MKNKRTFKKSIFLSVFAIGLLGGFLAIKLSNKKSPSSQAHFKNKANAKKVIQAMKASKKLGDHPQTLYVPPDTVIDDQKLYFEALKEEIEALNKEKNTQKKPTFKTKAKNSAKVFLSLYEKGK